MAGIIMVMLGLLFTTVNVPLITIKAYPEYHMIYNDSQMGEVIQKYVAHNMIGDKCTADIFSDVLGYIFILIGISLLIKYNIKFIRIYIPVIATTALYVFMKYLPFMYEGKALIINGLWASFVLLAVRIFTERMIVYTIADSTSDLPNQRDTVLMKFGWVGSALCRAFLYFIVLVGLADWIISVYAVVQIGFMIFCLDRMFRCRDYLKREEVKEKE